MNKLDDFEKDILSAYENGELKSTSPSKAELAKFKAAASATFLKEKRVNIRLSAPDLMDIQARARLSKYSNFKGILISRLMDSSRLKDRLELIENRC